MALTPADKQVTIDVRSGDSLNQVDRLAKAFALLEAKIEDVGTALTGLNRRQISASGNLKDNEEYNRILAERIKLMRDLARASQYAPNGNVAAGINRVTETAQRNSQAFSGIGMTARQIETAERRLADFRKASAAEEAVALSRRKTDLSKVNDLQQADLAIQAQIIKIVRQRNDIETKGATQSRLATLARYDDELRQLANLQAALKRADQDRKRMRLDEALGARAGNQQFTGAARGINDQIGLFRAQIAQMNLLDAATQQWARNQIQSFREAAQGAGVYFAKMQTTIQNAENALNNQINRQGRASQPKPPSRNQMNIEGLTGQIAALGGPGTAETLNLEVQLAKEKLKSLNISKGQSAEYAEQYRELSKLLEKQRAANTLGGLNSTQLTARTQAASAIRNDAVFGSGAADFFKFQAGLILNYTLLTQLQQGFFGVIQQVVDLDAAMKDLQAITGSNSEQMSQLNAAILDTASSTKFLNTEVAEGAKVLAQAGLTTEEITQSLKGVALFASATGTDFKDAADLMTSSLSVFNLRASETTNLANLFTAALNFSKLNSEQLGLAIQYVANTAAQAGIPIQDLVADVASLANAGIRSGSTIGTGLRQVIIDLMNPSEKLQARIKALGLSFADIDVQTRGLNPVLKTLTEAGFGVADAYATMETRSAAAFVALQGQQKGYNDLLTSITGTNAAVEANNIQMTSLLNTAKNTASVFTALASTALAPVVTVLQSLLAGFNDLTKSLTGLEPVLQTVGFLAASIGTGLGVALVARLLRLGTVFVGLGSAISGLITWMGALSVAFTSVMAGTISWGTALGALFSPAGWIVVGTVAVFGLVYALSSYTSAAEKAAKASEQAAAAVAEAKGRYDDNQKAISGVNEELNRMQVQEKTLRSDKDALNQTVGRLNERFGDLGLYLDSTANSFDTVMERVQAFRAELQNRTLVTIADLQARLERLNTAQREALKQSGGEIRRNVGDTSIGSAFGLGGLAAVYGVQPGQRRATSLLPQSVQTATNQSGQIGPNTSPEALQGMLDTLGQARADIANLLRDPAKVKELADAFYTSTDNMTKNLDEWFDASIKQTEKVSEILKSQRDIMVQEANRRIQEMATGPLSPAKFLGDMASALGRRFTQMSANAPADAIGRNQYMTQNGAKWIEAGLKGIEQLSRLGGSEFQEAVNRAAGGSLSNIQADVQKALIDLTAKSVEDYKKFLPDLMKSATTGMKLAGQNIENNFSGSGFGAALQGYMSALQIQLSLMAKDFATSIAKDPSLVGFDLNSFTVTGLGDLSTNEGRQLAGFITNQVGDAIVKAAAALTDDLKNRIGQADSQEEIETLKQNATEAVKQLFSPLIAGLERLKNAPGQSSEEVLAATVNLQGALDAQNAAIVQVNEQAAKGMQTLTDKANKAQEDIFNSIIEATDGLPTQVMSKEERQKLAGILQKILDAKKQSIIQGFIQDIMSLPGAWQQVDLPFGLGKINIPTQDTADALSILTRATDAQNKDKMNKFLNPKTAKYGDSSRSNKNERLLKPFEQFDDRRAEVDRVYDEQLRGIQSGSRITGISLDAVDYMKGYSQVERAALEAIQKQQQASELPKIMEAEKVRNDQLKALLADFNKVNVPRLEELKAVYDDSSKSNGARNAALNEYNKILKDQRGLEDSVTESTNNLADAQERYNVSVGKGVGQNLTFWEQLDAAIDQFSENNGSFVDQLANSIPSVLQDLSGSFNTFFSDMIEGTKSVGQAFEDLGKNILNSLTKALFDAASNSIVSELFGGTTGGGKNGTSGLGGLLGSALSWLGLGSGGSSGVTDQLGNSVPNSFWNDPAGGSGGGGWLDSIGSLLSSIGGWFNSGGIVRAAQGYVARDSKLVMARPGEGILRNTAMDAIGEDNFKRLNALGNNIVGSSRPDPAPALMKPMQQVREGDIVFNVTTPDADSFRRSENQLYARAGAQLNKSRRSLG